MSLDESLKFESLSAFQGGSSDKRSLKPTHPSRSGLQWLTVPSGCCGVVYQITDGGDTLQALHTTDDGYIVACSAALASHAVRLASSDDGRLVCLACADGSLVCFNATNESFLERWTLPNAHSHIVSDLNDSVSNARGVAASASGPIRSLQFETGSFNLLCVDAGKQTMTFLQGDSSTRPSPTVIDASHHITSAAWGPTTDSMLAVGAANGTIEIFEYSPKTQPVLTSKAQLKVPEFEDDDGEGDWACTHIDWMRSDSLAAGYCRVTADEDDEDDDEDEDDSAEHEASFCIHRLASDWTRTTHLSQLGDVVAFFSVPKAGRHVFYSCHTHSYKNGNGNEPFLLVASNVSSDVAVVACEPDSDEEFQIIDIPEGNNAAAPTDDEDEFTYPVGIATVLTADGPRLLLSSTDGSLASWKIRNIENNDFFPITNAQRRGVSVLPATPVEAAAAAPPNPKYGSVGFGALSSTSSPTTPERAKSGASSDETPASGTSAPIFGSKFGSGGFGAFSSSSSTTSPFGGGGTAASDASPFNAFGKPQAVSAAVALAKSLFGSPPAGSTRKEETNASSPPVPSTDKMVPSPEKATSPKAKSDAVELDTGTSDAGAPTGGFSFGSQPASGSGAPSGAFSFGAQPATTGGFNFSGTAKQADSATAAAPSSGFVFGGPESGANQLEAGSDKKTTTPPSTSSGFTFGGTSIEVGPGKSQDPKPPPASRKPTAPAKTSAGSAYPPVASKAPTPFGETRQAPKPTFGSRSTFSFNPSSTTSSSSTPFGVTAPRRKGKPTFGVTSPLGVAGGSPSTEAGFGSSAPLFGNKTPEREKSAGTVESPGLGSTSAPVFGSKFGSVGFGARSSTSSHDTPTHAWKRIGYLNDLVLKDTENEYPFTHFEWGATYNTHNILPVAIVGCHTVIMSVTRPYAQQDDGADLAWGTVVETCEEPSRKGLFKQSYFQLRDGQFMELFNNNPSSPSMFVRSLPAPWIYRRTVYLRSELDELMESFPFTKYEWATDFDGHSILPLTITDWNRGIRIHVTHPYAFGGSLEKAQMGTPVWTHGTDDKESKQDHFVQRYMKVQSFKCTKLPGVWDRGFPLYTRALDPKST